MPTKTVSKDRYIYVFEFSDNSAYVGLTSGKKRKHQHFNDPTDPVCIHITETNLQPIYDIVTNLMSEEEASELEKYYIKKYRNDSWNVLNTSEGGGLGGNYIIWTKEKCMEEISNYTEYENFRVNSSRWMLQCSG
jgi:hypothetical protein